MYVCENNRLSEHVHSVGSWPQSPIKILDRNKMIRVEVNDLIALCQRGTRCYHEGDDNVAFKYLAKAARLRMQSHISTLVSYQKGEGVEKDEKKGLHHFLEKAAIAGHLDARNNRIGCLEAMSDRNDIIAVKHFLIAADLGHDETIKVLKMFYANELVNKEDFATALLAHQAATDATTSLQRKAAEIYNSRAASRQLK